MKTANSNQMKTILGLVVAVIPMLLFCEVGCSKKSDHAALVLTFTNSTGEMMDETAIVLGQHRCTFGFVAGTATIAYWPKPVGTNAIVQWRDSKGSTQAVQVSLTGIYDPGVEGELIFLVESTNVTVRFIARGY